jgi:hypothetical protein
MARPGRKPKTLDINQDDFGYVTINALGGMEKRTEASVGGVFPK